MKEFKQTTRTTRWDRAAAFGPKDPEKSKALSAEERATKINIGLAEEILNDARKKGIHVTTIDLPETEINGHIVKLMPAEPKNLAKPNVKVVGPRSIEMCAGREAITNAIKKMFVETPQAELLVTYLDSNTSFRVRNTVPAWSWTNATTKWEEEHQARSEREKKAKKAGKKPEDDRPVLWWLKKDHSPESEPVPAPTPVENTRPALWWMKNKEVN